MKAISPSMELRTSVERFAALTFSVSDQDLERAWVWGEYDEGVRYAFFRTYEELRSLAAGIVAYRLQAGLHLSYAQHLLGLYHAAFLDLRAVLLGVDDHSAVQEPAAGEWPIRQVLLHIVQTERSFFTVTNYALERVRNRDGRPLEISGPEWDAFWDGDSFDRIKEMGSFTETLEYYERLHQRVLDTFIDTTLSELDAPSVFWESAPMPIQFRMHRFDSHLRQHTIQIEKARLALTLAHPEALRLCRLIYAALAEVEGVSLGADGVIRSDQLDLAKEIDSRRLEISRILQGEFYARPSD